MKRVRLIISGDVQGVGFRAWTRLQARELSLTGWVKNREDGAVEIVVEGAKEGLTQFISRCRKGPEVAWVEKVDVAWSEQAGEFAGFEVIY